MVMRKTTDNIDLESKIKLVNSFGITIKDRAAFTKQVHFYGFNEIFWQYVDCFPRIASNKRPMPRHPKDFADIFALYQLDQKLKNIMMISLQLFEQSFKAALVTAVSRENEGLTELLNVSYQLKSGRVIRRGDLKSRIRRIKQNYQEPFTGYKQLNHNTITNWVLIKEMSFGIATNTFFLLNLDLQHQVLSSIFKQQISVEAFEQVLAGLRIFRHRAAHDYRLLGVKAHQHYLYDQVLDDLSLLSNPDPYQNATGQFKQIIADYLTNYPEMRSFLNQNFSVST